MDFATGWDPAKAALAKAALRQGTHATVKAVGVPKAPAKSLTKYRRRSLQQGRAGTCWVHAPTQHAEFMMRLRGVEGYDVCRRLVGYEGCKLMGGGNPTDGGTGAASFGALAKIGAAHESLCPYSDERWTLGTKPPQAVYSDAAKVHLTTPIDVKSLDDVITLIDADDTPSAIGIWWPFGWDSGQTFMTEIGRGVFGHELLIVGYALGGVLNEHTWLQIDNWHGDLYPVLHPELAKKVPGYTTFKSDHTSDFWVERGVLEKVMGYGNSDLNSATDIEGLKSPVIEVNSIDGFPV